LSGWEPRKGNLPVTKGQAANERANWENERNQRTPFNKEKYGRGGHPLEGTPSKKNFKKKGQTQKEQQVKKSKEKKENGQTTWAWKK